MVFLAISLVLMAIAAIGIILSVYLPNARQSRLAASVLLVSTSLFVVVGIALLIRVLI